MREMVGGREKRRNKCVGERNECIQNSSESLTD